MKSGTIAIVGSPNVGKSTLLNTLVREKVAIVSDKPQTTRTRILGILHLPDAQVALLDTPGLHSPRHLLNRRMIRTALDAMREADLFYVMVQATRLPSSADRAVIGQVREFIGDGRNPAFLLINKIDLVAKPRLLPLIDEYSRMLPWAEIVPISAETGLNVDRLLELTRKQLEEGQPSYQDDALTDQSMRTLAAEFIREKILQAMREELPHSVAVSIDKFVEEGKLARVEASILVEKESQKPIVVGRRGERLKTVGTLARLDMERLFGVKVALHMWVKVKKDWRENESILAELGY